jgi:hypothetical protein
VTVTKVKKEQSTTLSKTKPKGCIIGKDYSKSDVQKEKDWALRMIEGFGLEDPWVQLHVLGKRKGPKVKCGAAKGKKFERECANILGHIFPEAKRHLEYQADEALDGEDLEGTDIFKFQMKNRQNYAPVGTIKEVRTKDPNHIPVLVTKGNRMDAMAVLPFEKFVTLLEIAYGHRCLLNEKPKQLRHENATVFGMPVILDSEEPNFKIEYRKETALEDLV